MSTKSIDDATASAREPLPETKGSVMRGVLVGLIPLGLLACCVALTVALTALARQLMSGSGFYAQQQAALIMVIVGLVLTVAVFAVAVWRVVRRVATWQQSGVTAQAQAALWSLGASALVIVIPLLLAILLPQHPFP
jgi:ABC-type nickel/cobalt efflux system permease component RcnA